jgi:hypothetical protein
VGRCRVLRSGWVRFFGPYLLGPGLDRLPISAMLTSDRTGPTKTGCYRLRASNWTGPNWSWLQQVATSPDSVQLLELTSLLLMFHCNIVVCYYIYYTCIFSISWFCILLMCIFVVRCDSTHVNHAVVVPRSVHVSRTLTPSPPYMCPHRPPAHCCALWSACSRCSIWSACSRCSLWSACSHCSHRVRSFS